MKFFILSLLLICSVGCKIYEQTGYCQQPQRVIPPQLQKEVVVKHEYDGPWPYYWKPFIPPRSEPAQPPTNKTKTIIQVLPIDKVVIYTTTNPTTVPVVAPSSESDAYKKLRLEQHKYWWDR